MNRRPSGPAVIAALAAITLIGPLSIHIFLPLMPEVKHAFDLPDSLVGLACSISLLAFAASTLVYGALSDRHGRRPVLLGGPALFCAGSALTAFAPSGSAMLAGRVLQALGAGCGVTPARAIVRDTFGTESLVKVVSYLSMAATLGPVLTQFFTGAVFSQIYVLFADGTPQPLVFTASPSVGLAVITGAIPYALSRRGGAR